MAVYPLPPTRTQHKNNSATETHQTIEEQTKVFLSAGNKVLQIPDGVSGQEKERGGRKHITL